MTPAKRLAPLSPGGATSGPAKPVPRLPLDEPIAVSLLSRESDVMSCCMHFDV